MNFRLGRLFAGLAVVALTVAVPASAKDRIKIGMLTTLSGSSAEIGQDMVDGFNLGIKNAGGKLGGLPVEVVTGDDQAKPDTGRQIAEKMVERDGVDVITGTIFSNVFQAMYKPVLDAGVFIIAPQAHLHTLAGKECNANFIMLGTQSDNYAESTGAYAKKAGYKRVYVLAPNYAAGKAVVTGFKRQYDLPLAGEALPAFGQLDFAAEIAQIRATKPDAVYVFMPGGMGLAFLKQYAASGMMKEAPHLAGWAAYDPSTLAAVGDAALGAIGTTDWNPDMKYPSSEKFVKDFMAAYKRPPSHYAAMAYEVTLLLDVAVKQVNGKIEDKKAFSQALRTVKFDSLRGPNFKLNTNGFPIADHYVIRVVKGPDGKPMTQLGEIAIAGLKDPYVAECPMR